MNRSNKTIKNIDPFIEASQIYKKSKHSSKTLRLHHCTPRSLPQRSTYRIHSEREQKCSKILHSALPHNTSFNAELYDCETSFTGLSPLSLRARVYRKKKTSKRNYIIKEKRKMEWENRTDTYSATDGKKINKIRGRRRWIAICHCQRLRQHSSELHEISSQLKVGTEGATKKKRKKKSIEAWKIKKRFKEFQVQSLTSLRPQRDSEAPATHPTRPVRKNTRPRPRTLYVNICRWGKEWGVAIMNVNWNKIEETKKTRDQNLRCCKDRAKVI